MKTKIKLYEVLTEKEQNDIFEIVRKIKSKIDTKELTYNQAFLKMKYSSEIKNWLENLERKHEFYDCFIPLLHQKLLSGYKNIIQPLVDEGVLIASNAGTQLGVIRDGQLIGWDDDIDLIMDIKDFNKWEHKLRAKALRHGWYLWKRDWIKNNFKNYKNKGMVWVQLFAIRKFEFDFGRFKSSFWPFIDIFPGIRVDKGIEQEIRENISLELVKYYHANENKQNIRERFSKNKKIENEAPRYFGMLNDDNNFSNYKMKKSKETLREILTENYKPESSIIMQLHPATPVFSNFDYNKNQLREIKMYGNKYRFFISDNYEEQFTKEYGDNWKEPRLSHMHMILPWRLKFK